jgi:hypothetical protein
MLKVAFKFALKFLPLILHEIADLIKERQDRKKETDSLTSKIQENENIE